jgi:N-carbamoyl-L-amino-acid hydrolase
LAGLSPQGERLQTSDQGVRMLVIEPQEKRIERDIETLSRFVDPDEEGFTRISFSREYRQALDYLAGLMAEEADLEVSMDAVGNLTGRRPGGMMNAPAIVVGSHVDTVRGGGRFDGIVGVVGGLEVARFLKESGTSLLHPLEVVAFVAEEPSPFGISTIGSRAMAGKLTRNEVDTLRDAEGRTLAEAIRQLGGDPQSLETCRRDGKDISMYIELHIEQGPVLEEERCPLGIVSGIAGITRGTLELIGRNDHAGTSPMHVRRDALVAASEAILAVERVCRSTEGVVGTVGRIESFPNALNVVPGLVRLGLEVRSLDEDRITRVIDLLRADLSRIQAERGIHIRHRFITSSHVVKFQEETVALAARLCQALGMPHLVMPSGAGHDANHIAEIAPACMIFVPSRGGRSHCPEEFTEPEHITQGVRLLAALIGEVDKR